MTLKRLENGEIYFGKAKWTPWGTIDCLVQHEETGEVLNFHATPYDELEYGRELFMMLSRKYKSKVTPCSEEEKYDAFSKDVRGERDYLLKRTDWTQTPDVPEATRKKFTEYRQALRDVTSQEGFPFEIEWPELPN